MKAVLAALFAALFFAVPASAGKGAPQGKVIPVYIIVSASYTSNVTVAQTAQWVQAVLGSPSDAPCTGSTSCTVNAWFRAELGRVFNYQIVVVPAQPAQGFGPVDACGRFSDSGLYVLAENQLTYAGIRPPARFFMVTMGAGGWAGHFSPADGKLNMGMVGDWGAEEQFGVRNACIPDWDYPARGISHEFAGMLGMYVTDGYNGAMFVGDTMTANNKADLIRYSGSWLRTS